MKCDFALEIEPTFETLGFRYGGDTFGPVPELRRLDDIRPSLRNPSCGGPDPVYAIAMDVARQHDRAELISRNLLYGVVVYAAGRLGEEPVRSQGHVHKISRNSGWAAPEVFEIWAGRAVIYMQERTDDDPGCCIGIEAGRGDRVVAPPGWAHAVISADAAAPLVFGAWCDRDYGFVYEGVRAHGGLAWFPVLDAQGAIKWEANPRYTQRPLEVRKAREYPELRLDPSLPLYAHLREKPEGVQWVSNPGLAGDVWTTFRP